MRFFRYGLLFCFCLASQAVFCQQSMNSGAFQTGNFSFSVGQVFTADVSGSPGSSQQGIHQVYPSVPLSFSSDSFSDDFDIFPVPAQQEINIRLQGESLKAYSVKLMDLRGRQLALWPDNTGTVILDLSAFSAGMYLLELECEGRKTIKKFSRK